MNNLTALTYINVVLGFLLGILMLAAAFMYLTEKANEHLTTKDAADIVFAKGKWSWVISILVLATALYLLPEIFENILKVEAGQKKPAEWILSAVRWIRMSSFTLGVASQTLGLLFVSQVLQRAAKLNLFRGLEKAKEVEK